MTAICQAYFTKNPLESLNSFTDSQLYVTQYFLNNIAQHGEGVSINQTIMGRIKGLARETISNTVSVLRELGLIESKRRFNRESSYFLGSSAFVESVRDALWIKFGVRMPFEKKKKIPNRINHNTQEYKSKINTQILNPDHDPDPERDNISLFLNPVLEISCAREEPVEKRSHVDIESTVRKVLGIEQALIARGETLEQIDTAKLAAFPVEGLDAVSKEMKHHAPTYPFRFFMSKLHDWCEKNGKSPNYHVSDWLRGTPILEQFRPSVVDAIKQKQAVKADAAVQSSPDHDRIEPSSATASDGKKRMLDAHEVADLERRNNEKTSAAFEAHLKRRQDQAVTTHVNARPFLETILQGYRNRLQRDDITEVEKEKLRFEILEMERSL